MRWDGVVYFVLHFVCGVPEWTVVHEKTGIITTDESLRPSMKTFGTLIEQNISCLHVDLVGVSLKIFDDDWPRLRVLRVVNVEYTTVVYNMRFNAKIVI